MVDQRLDGAAALQHTTLNLIKKARAHVRLSYRSDESANMFTGKPLL